MDERKGLHETSMVKLDKKYKVIITDADSGEEITSDMFSGLCLVGEGLDNESMCEIVLNENIVNIAAMLSAGKKTSHAIKLATFVDNMRKDDLREQATDMEDMLSDLLSGTQGGIQ